jgi:hypothetical protein
MWSAKEKFLIEYQLDIFNSTLRFNSGKWWGRYLVLETTHNDFHLYDVEDVLFLQPRMILPGTENFQSLTNENPDFYIWMSDTRIVIPMIKKHNPKEKGDGYLFYYDLSKPIHTWLIQKLHLGSMNKLVSILK